MNQHEWAALTPQQKNQVHDNSDLTPQLIGLEGYRVEVLDDYGETRRFIVGKSTGWKPCHIELKRRNSWGGGSADKQYKTVKVLYKAI
jgi:hypothetical protein